MNSNRTEWQIRCTFNGFCKSVLRNETIDMLRKSWALKKREVVFQNWHNMRLTSCTPMTNILGMIPPRIFI